LSSKKQEKTEIKSRGGVGKHIHLLSTGYPQFYPHLINFCYPLAISININIDLPDYHNIGQLTILFIYTVSTTVRAYIEGKDCLRVNHTNYV
jgi:hypothetical protein